jgi:hypothetical protein
MYHWNKDGGWVSTPFSGIVQLCQDSAVALS